MAIITQALLDSLRTQFTLKFDQAYSGIEPVWPKLATEVPSSAKSNTYGWIAQQIAMRKWVGPRVAQNLKEHVAVVTNDPFEATIELDRDDIEDDNIGMFASVTVPGLAAAAKKHPDRLLKNLLGANPVTWDGNALFSTGHPCFDAGVSTYTNDYTTTPLNAANFNTVWSAMTSIVGEDGEPLEINPNVLLVPPQLKLAALQIMQGTTAALPVQNAAKTDNVAAVAVDNVFKGWCDVVVMPQLAGAPATWYVLDTSHGVSPFIYQLRRPASFVQRMNPDDPKVFEQKQYSYGVEGRWQMAPALPFLVARSAA